MTQGRAPLREDTAESSKEDPEMGWTLCGQPRGKALVCHGDKKGTG